MSVRDIVHIHEELCNGCGECVTACAEGAIEIIDGKARLVSDVYCDGLGACLGHCPQGAIEIIRRESAAFDEEAVAERLTGLASQPTTFSLPVMGAATPSGGGCPGSRAMSLRPSAPAPSGAAGEASQLTHWPVQLHLVPPTAPFFVDKDVLLAADCVAYAAGGFHSRFLAGKSLTIACPKLDANQETYLHKLVAMIDQAKVRSVTVLVMEVPCCSGLLRLVQQAQAMAQRTVPISCRVISIRGEVLAEHQVA